MEVDWFEIERGGWPCPHVRSYPRLGDKYVRVEAIMGSGTGVQLSEKAQRGLWEFFGAYLTAHGLLTDACGGAGPDGAEVDVLPEHAAEMEARLRVFITDPANHYRIPNFWGARVLVMPDGGLESARIVQGTPEDTRDAMRKARQAVEAAYPHLLADPLCDVPGVDKPPCTQECPRSDGAC